jgi:hypothetical protein
MDDESWIAVWLPMANQFLNQDALALYGRFVLAAGNSLHDESLGYFEGAMTGTTNVNLSFTLAPGAGAERAISLVVDALKECKHDAEAIVAHGGFVTRDGKPYHFEKAVWPPHFCGELPR